MGESLKRSGQNSNFSTTHAMTNKIFGISKYEQKIKFEKNYGYQDDGSSSNGAAKLQTF